MNNNEKEINGSDNNNKNDKIIENGMKNNLLKNKFNGNGSNVIIKDLSSFSNNINSERKNDIKELKNIINKYKSLMDTMDSMKIDSIFLKLENI